MMYWCLLTGSLQLELKSFFVSPEWPEIILLKSFSLLAPGSLSFRACCIFTMSQPVFALSFKKFPLCIVLRTAGGAGPSVCFQHCRRLYYKNYPPPSTPSYLSPSHVSPPLQGDTCLIIPPAIWQPSEDEMLSLTRARPGRCFSVWVVAEQ